jgi:DNA-binding PadR family transcriptional regulator
LNRLTDEGYVSVREESQEKRPDRKVYSITPAGRTAFIASLLKPLPEDRHRSPFVFAMLFADLLPQSRVSGLLDTYIEQVEQKLAHLNSHSAASHSGGEKFVSGFGRAVYVAILDFLTAHRAEIEEQRAAEAAE